MLSKEAVALQALAGKIVNRHDELLVERGAHKVCLNENVRVRVRGVCEAPGDGVEHALEEFANLDINIVFFIMVYLIYK
jgi:hypothetical protein